MAARKKRTFVDTDASGKVMTQSAPRVTSQAEATAAATMLAAMFPLTTAPAPTPAAPPSTPAAVPAPALGAAEGYFSQLSANVKLANMALHLSPCTAIVSERNRAGKTAVLDAFRLALTGKHPIGPHAADLMGLTPDESLPRATLRGEKASSAFAFADGLKTAAPTRSGEFQALDEAAIAGLLPLVAHRELLTLGTAKAREELFRRFGATTLPTATAAPAGLSPEQVALWDSALQGDGRLGALDSVEKLTAAGTQMRSLKRTLSAQLKALEEEKQRLHATQADAGAATEDAMQEVQRKLDIYKARAHTTAVQAHAQQTEAQLLALITEFEQLPPTVSADARREALAAIEVKYQSGALQAKVAAAQAGIDRAQNNVRLFTLLVRLREQIKADGCIVCAAPQAVTGVQVDQLVIAAERELADARVAVQTALQEQAQDSARLTHVISARASELQALQLQWGSQEANRKRLTQALQSAQEHYLAARELLVAAGVQEAPSESLEQLQQQLLALQTARQSAVRASELAALIRAKSIEQQDAKVVEAQLGVVLNALVGTVRAAAQEAVNLWMPPGFKAALMLEDEGGKPACRWEIVGTDGRPHPYGAASGAEWAALTVAIACAWSEGQKFRFLLLDDSDLAGFNAENVRNTLTMVAEAVRAGRLTQALVAWSRPMEIPAAGWSVVAP